MLIFWYCLQMNQTLSFELVAELESAGLLKALAQKNAVFSLQNKQNTTQFRNL